MEAILFALLLVGAMILFLGLRGTHAGTRTGGSSKAVAPVKGDPLPYRLKPALLSPAERSFWGVLQRVMPNEFLIWPKVRLLDLLLVEGNGSKRLSALNRVQAKHVDFVVVRAKDAKPILAIELDDNSHQRTERQERDRFLEELMQKVGLPLLRVRARDFYTPQALKTLLAPYLEEGILGQGPSGSQ